MQAAFRVVRSTRHSARVEVSTRDEVADLTRAFNDMSSSLLEKRRGLGMFVIAGACCALTDDEQRRFDHLRHKHQTKILTNEEVADLQALWQQVERMNVVRLEALMKLAQLRGTDVRTCMHDLGLDKHADVF